MHPVSSSKPAGRCRRSNQQRPSRAPVVAPARPPLSRVKNGMSMAIGRVRRHQGSPSAEYGTESLKALLQTYKRVRSNWPKPLILLARPAGFEPTTPWFVGSDLKHLSICLLTYFWHVAALDLFIGAQRRSKSRAKVARGFGDRGRRCRRAPRRARLQTACRSRWRRPSAWARKFARDRPRTESGRFRGANTRRDRRRRCRIVPTCLASGPPDHDREPRSRRLPGPPQLCSLKPRSSG